MTKVEITPEMLAKLVAEAVAAQMAEIKATQGSAAKDARAEKNVKMDVAIARAFEKKGYKKIVLFDRTKLLSQQPDVTILTYNKWVELGRKVKPGENAIKIKQFRLFHKDQTEIMDVETRKKEWAQFQEAIKRYEAKKAGASA